VGRAVVGVQFLLHGFSTLIELSAFAAAVSASKVMMVRVFIRFLYWFALPRSARDEHVARRMRWS